MLPIFTPPRVISIHALLAESDRPTTSLWILTIYFYPRSPCGERHREQIGPLRHSGFLSTLSLRRATPCDTLLIYCHLYFYPRSPCGERPRLPRSGTARGMYFYPRSPCGERPGSIVCRRPHDISIHALLAESDQELFRIVKPSYNFYPRSPCGERPSPAI